MNERVRWKDVYVQDLCVEDEMRSIGELKE